MPFPFYKQLNSMDCGPTCLRMIAMHYGKHYSADTIRQRAGFTKRGVSLLGISDTAEQIGFRTRGVQITANKLMTAPLPAILHWNHDHFVVLVDLNRKKAKIADPAVGVLTYTKQEFLSHWISSHIEEDGNVGVALLLEPTATFYEKEGEKQQKLNWTGVTQYLKQNRWPITQVFISFLIGFFIQLIFPFLTQSMVDTGINTRNMQYMMIVLFAQLMLTFSSTVITFIRSRLQLRISNSVNISILSDFWIKLTRLPLSYFDSRHAGDTMRRIDDNKQIQTFITGQPLSIIFSLLNFIVYAIILVLYSVPLFFVFLTGHLLYFGWITLFMRIRRKINYASFHLAAKENNATLQLIQGMQEIRLNNAERGKRWEWENIQASLFKLAFKQMNYDQWQSTGALFITQGKDIIISFIVAKLVVEGKLTFGAMLAVQYIIGQLSGPIMQFVGLAQSIQDVRISMERLNEINEIGDEEPVDRTFQTHLPDNKSIHISKLSFRYPGSTNEPVLKNINLTIPEGKVTAIVGVSGSGKTTLLKLLLKIYEQYEGNINIHETNFKFISPAFWRSQCGSVLQDGFIFNDTIARNIAVGVDQVDLEKLIFSCKIASILPFIESLPNSFNTLLGAEGIGVSQGQKQRILIARAVYKDPQYLFFDEATNALDTNNERSIVENLQQFFRKKTVVIVAHRLSTVKNADKIIVLHNGEIAETGSHEELTKGAGHYYQLVKNQLELGN